MVSCVAIRKEEGVSYTIFSNGRWFISNLERLNHELHRPYTDNSINNLKEMIENGKNPVLNSRDELIDRFLRLKVR